MAFQDPLPDRSLCYVPIVRRTPSLTGFQDPLPDRSLCYATKPDTHCYASATFRILCRIVPSATGDYRVLTNTPFKAFRILCRIVPSATKNNKLPDEWEAKTFRILCRIVPSATPRVYVRARSVQVFQYPLPDRSLCYALS